VKTTCSDPPGISLKRQIGISLRRALRESREFSPPRRVFAIGGASGDGAHPLSLNRQRILYAVKADGQRFLVNLPVGQDTSSPITVVLNWTAGEEVNVVFTASLLPGFRSPARERLP